MIFGRKSRARTCPLCQRDKKTAISEQLSSGTPCGPDECKFKADILAVLQIVEFHPAKQSGEPGKDLDSILEKLEASADSVKGIGRRKELSSSGNDYVEDDLGRKYRRKKNLKRILKLLVFLVILSIISWFVTKSSSKSPSYQTPLKAVQYNNLYKKQKPETVSIHANSTSDPDKIPKLDENEMNALLYQTYLEEDSTMMNNLIGTWKGMFQNDSISLFITGISVQRVYGFVKKEGRSIIIEGRIWNSDENWVISLLEPGTGSNDGEYNLKWYPESSSIEGEWKSDDRRTQSKIFLKKSEK